MLKIKNTLIKYNYDFLAILIFSSIFCCLCFLTWGHLGDPFIDCGREAYIPQTMLRGNVLLKDIFLLYNPLSYQVNALLFKFFGENFSTLYFAGIVSSYGILLTLYLIMRVLFKQPESFSVVVITMALGVFQNNIFNYIFPYTYAMVYALLFLLLSVLMCVYAIKVNIDSKKFKLLVFLSSFFLGVSIANKWDFLLIAIPILFIPILYKKFKLFDYGYFLLFLLLPVLISYFLLFHQGLSIQNFFNYISFGTTFLSTGSLSQYSNTIYWFSPLKYAYLIGINFIKFISFFFLNYLILKIYFKYWRKIFSPLILILFLYIDKILYNNYFNIGKIEFLLCWFAPFCIIYLIYLVFKNYKKEQFLSDELNVIQYFVLICSILSLAKTYFFINLYTYGSYFIPLAIIALFIIFTRIIKNKVSISLSIFFILYGYFILVNTLEYKQLFNSQIFNSKGILYTSASQAEIIDRTIMYIRNNVGKNDTCLVLPEGSVINFITGRQSKDKFYHLLPNHIDALNEKNIEKALEKNKPEYIFINNRNTAIYGKAYFCKDYAFEICEYINRNYKLVKQFACNKTDFSYNPNNGISEMLIYELKQN